MKKALYLFFLIILFLPVVNAENIEVDTFEELKEAVLNENAEISIMGDFEFTEKLTITKDLKVNGNKHTIKRNSEYDGTFLTVLTDVTLDMNNIIIDGSSSEWKLDYDNKYYTGADNSGYIRVPVINSDSDVVSTTSLIINDGSLSLDGAMLKNNRASVNGAVISGAGNNNFSNSRFEHNGSAKYGGVLYSTGGTTVVDNCSFIDNGAGVGVSTSNYGGAIYTKGTLLLELKNNTIFDSNFAQGNGGAIYINDSSINVKDVKFINNMVGNDGAAISLTSARDGDTAYFENVVFDSNKGLALTGQSMGIVWIDSWKYSSEEKPIIFKKIVAFGNVAMTGVISDKSKVSVFIEDADIYNNDIRVGTAVYSQTGSYNIINTKIHDNKSQISSAAIHFKNSKVSMNLDNVSIYNNETPGNGTISMSNGGILNIKNSIIFGNESKSGTLSITSSDVANPAIVSIENTRIHSNNVLEYGGGVYINDSAGVYTSFDFDDSSKIYDNIAGLAGDDFVYIREDVGTKDDNDITLNNVNSYGINGIDALYHDNANDRFSTTNNPMAFENYINYNAGSIYLKAAGEVELSYDLNGGLSSNKYEVEYTKYGSSFNVTDDKPSIENGEFIGWNTKPDGSGYWYYDTDTYKGEHGKVLYAQYRLKEPEVNPGTNSGDFIIVLVILVIVSMTILVLSTNSYVKLI